MTASHNHVSHSRPQKTAMLIAKRIVDDIQRGGYALGDRLPAERLMLEEYRIGRGTLREALRFLELQGVISLKPGPGGGPTVEKPESSHLANGLLLLLQFGGAPFSVILEARVDLEPIMARHAASRMTDEQLLLLTKSVDLMRSNLGDREIFLQSNRDFHEQISWASGNQMYGFLIDALIGIVDGTALGVDYPVKRREDVADAHTRILEALLAHDGDASEESMALHMQGFTRYLNTRFAEVLAEPVTWNMV